ncbi:MAG: 16S rRNA (guanine(527)-N(7))-methyltransferase RsmG [Aliishimia sp.]
MFEFPKSVGNVSRETAEKLVHFVDLVKKWTPKVNLISKNSVADIWSRHIEDSIQIATLSPNPRRWIDIGSGGGFPGIIVATVLSEDKTPQKMTLIESDNRKCAFLRMAARELGLEVDVVAQRIENINGLAATTLSARALAPLNDLLAYADRHLQKEGTAIFPKGASWEKELKHASSQWSFQYEAITSKTDPSASILVIQSIEKK